MSEAMTGARAALSPAGGLGQLRFLTCGSVDDGKSTLIGRLLYDTRLLMDDQMEQLRRDSARHGTAGDGLDFALLVDGLEAERQQGITIDVAYRYFATARRRFIVADTPGHEQYTRNMATGAAAAELAVLLVDARKGILTQTRRHAFIAGLMGIRHVVLAVNKIDLVGFDQGVFDAIVADFMTAAEGQGFLSVQAIPLSARDGDNVIARSLRTPWYDGPSLLSHLESVRVDDDRVAAPFRLPVQWVNRPDLDFRGYSGTVAGGRVRPGDRVVALPSGRDALVRRIVTMDGDLDEAAAGAAVTLVLDREIDLARGDVLADPAAPPAVTGGLVAHVVWLTDAPLRPGRGCLVKLGTKVVSATATTIRALVDMDTGAHAPTEALALNDIGVVELHLQTPVVFDAYADSRTLGGFIVIDRQTNATIGVGMVIEALRPARDVVWQTLDVDRAARARLKHQGAGVVWLTGLSGSGKSTIANLVERRLHALGHHTYILDGDRLRHGMNADLGFAAADRAENVRRIGEMAALFVDAGLIVLVSAISPYRAGREHARAAASADRFLEVFVDAPIEACRRRDPKGLYQRVDAGLIQGFTGVDDPYEAPDAADLVLATETLSAEAAAEQVLLALRHRGWVG